MKLLLKRRVATANSTIGDLFVDGQRECFTLEPPKRERKPRAIPAGTYDVTIRWSEKHQRLMPHVENVPGFEGIEIHVGNYPRDTEGCILVGEHYAETPDYIGNSREAFDQLWRTLQYAHLAQQPILISIVDPEAP